MTESVTGSVSTGAAGGPEKPTNPFGARFTTPLLLGSTFNPINSSLIATGLVGIGVDLHIRPGSTALLISVLYLCSAVAQPTMGKLSTIFGPRRVFLAGAIILVLAGVIGTLAPGFGFLLVSRALIGIGTSAAYPTAMALARRRADQNGIGVPSRFLGNLSIAAQVVAAVGLPLGGVLTGAFGWRALFFVNIPLGLLSIALTLTGVARDGRIESNGVGTLLRRIDLPGIALFAATVVSLLIFLGALAQPIWWLLAVTLALGVGLVLWERRSSSPLIDVRMLARNRPLQRTYLRQLLVSLATYSVLYGISQWLELGRGLGASQVGLILLPLTVISIVLARVISGRGWVRVPLLLAGAVLAVAAGLEQFVTHETSILGLIGLTVLLGTTNGLAGFANQATLYANAPASEIAVASGLFRTALYVGAIFSASLIGIVFGGAPTDAGLHALAWVQLGLGVALVLLVAFDRWIPAVAAK
ncbi:MAG: MFS transporter [Actinomycetota bacterium]|nr:MFS transporter [Actinomycetota bacterium]